LGISWRGLREGRGGPKGRGFNTWSGNNAHKKWGRRMLKKKSYYEFLPLEIRVRILRLKAMEENESFQVERGPSLAAKKDVEASEVPKATY